MKQFSKTLIIFLLFFNESKCLKNFSSQSFIFTRPAYFNIAAKNCGISNLYYSNPDLLVNSQDIGIFQKSLENNRCSKLPQYFLLKNRNVLSIKGDSVTTTDRDVRAEWLELPSNFVGDFSLLPGQTQLAVLIDIRRNIGCYLQCCFLNNLWFGLAIPFVSVKNKLNLQETSNNKNFSIIKQLNKNKFGKFVNENSSVGLAEMQLQIGNRYYSDNGIQADFYTYLSIPLEPKQTDCLIFPAIRGFNGHVGWGFIVNLQMQINNDCSNYKCFGFFEAENIYLFQNTQWRSLDLLDKQWSRFLLLNKNDGTIDIPAINVLTQRVEVQPFNFVDISTGFRINKSIFEAEIGYSLWLHGDEKLKLKNPFPEEYGIAAKAGDLTPTGLPATASKSTIAKQAATDKDAEGNNTFIAIKDSDLNFCSGAARETITQGGYFAINLNLYSEKFAGIVSTGIFYESPLNNAALKQWGFWCKLGIAF